MEIYLAAERKGRLFSKFVSLFLLSCMVTLFLLSLIHSWISMGNGNYKTSTWFSPYKFHSPFDTSTVFGWYMLWLIQVYAGYTYNLSISVIIMYFVSCCFYIEACCKHFITLYNEFDSYLTKDERKSIAAKRQLHEAILFHIEVIK